MYFRFITGIQYMYTYIVFHSHAMYYISYIDPRRTQFCAER